MAETQAVSSPAETADPFNGQQPTVVEYNSYRETGELPERFKPAEKAESATADAPEQTADETEAETPENESESESEEAQEPPHKVSPAEKRIKQLLAEKKDLERKLEAAAKPTQQSDSSTAQVPKPPQNFKEWQSGFKPSQWIEEFAKTNPEASYEDANFAMGVFVSDARDHFRSIEQQNQEIQKNLESVLSGAKEKYEDFDEIRGRFAEKAFSDGKPAIPLAVIDFFDAKDSPLMADVLYTIGSDEAALDDFISLAKRDPRQAIRYAARVELLIEEEFEKQKGSDAAQQTSGKAPERQRTAAPAPPSPVGGSSARTFDVNDESLSADDWMRKRNAQLARK